MTSIKNFLLKCMYSTETMLVYKNVLSPATLQLTAISIVITFLYYYDNDYECKRTCRLVHMYSERIKENTYTCRKKIVHKSFRIREKVCINVQHTCKKL